MASSIRVSPGEAWNHVITPSGVNAELWPILRMSFPSSVESLTESWEPGRRMFRSWILLFGLIPVEYDDLTLVEVDDGHRFLERSEMLTQRVWQHEREILEERGGARIVDRVSFVSRIPWLEPLQLLLFRAVFRYRHLRIRRQFGGAAT